MEDRPGDPPPWLRVYLFLVHVRHVVLFFGIAAYAIAALVVGRTTAAHLIGVILLGGCSIVAAWVIRKHFARFS